MKEYEVTESYTVTRKLRVLAPSPPFAADWDVHDQAMVLDQGEYEEKDYKVKVKEVKHG